MNIMKLKNKHFYFFMFLIMINFIVYYLVILTKVTWVWEFVIIFIQGFYSGIVFKYIYPETFRWKL